MYLFAISFASAEFSSCNLCQGISADHIFGAHSCSLACYLTGVVREMRLRIVHYFYVFGK